MSRHDWDTSWLGPAVYSAPSTRCQEPGCDRPLSEEEQAQGADICAPCALDHATTVRCVRCGDDLLEERREPRPAGHVFTGQEGYCLSCEPSEAQA